MEREEVERDAVEREPLERDADERGADERDAVEREPVEREPEERDAVEPLVLRELLRAVPALARELALRVVRAPGLPAACVSAWRSLSKSLRACLLVLAASRRSARSAVVTSL